MNKTILLLALSASVSFISCKKIESNLNTDIPGTLSAPTEFDWRTTKNLTLEFQLSDTRFSDELQVISVYDGHPENGGQLITQGAISLKSKFISKIDLEKNAEELYIVKSAPDGTEFTQKVPVIGSYTNLLVGAERVISALSLVPAKKLSENLLTVKAASYIDTDGDGVTDINDTYPNDKGKAFVHCSINFAAGGSTVAFEDNWPLKGDYDMNDVVLNYRYRIITNSHNKVVHIKADYKLLATGGNFENAAGIQFNIPKANAVNLVAPPGVSIEQGQDSLVLVLFTNSRLEQAEWNTESLRPISAPNKYTISFDVLNGASIAEFGVGTYNPFIWNNTSNYGRAYETHLRGKNPTKLALRALFNTGDDRSNDGTTYVTSDNLPWAIELPIANFAYPKELVDMTSAYGKFGEWVLSKGAHYRDWYSNTAPGYRDVNKIFPVK